tara:strand:+ start:1023 stop:1754 length:732 start_codon:yes stop_codon:yes gene_type:complete
MKKILFFLFIIFLSNSIYSNEIQIISEQVGDGIEVLNHSKVSVHYIGKLEDQSEFDNSYKRGQEFQFQVGTRQVIPGWETGLIGMKEGGKRTIFIPYPLAYGDSGAGNLIPPKSNLIFEIEVISVIPPRYKNIDSLQFKLASTDNSFKIIDIRYETEIKKSGKIPNSLILNAFDQNGNFLPEFLNSYQSIINVKDKVIFVSQKGIISSILANGFVEQLNQDNIYNLVDGVDGLKNINFNFENY